MGLPTVSLPRETVSLPDGQTIEIRALSRAEVFRLGEHADDPVEGEIVALAHATDTPVEEVRSWYEGAPYPIVQALATAIRRLSGTDEDAGKESSED